MRINLQAAVLAALTLTACSTVSGQALYSTGFEAPAFVPGALEGQNDWASDPTTLAGATVQTAVVQKGSQAAMITASALFPGTTWFFVPLNYTADEVIAPLVDISWDMLLTPATSKSGGWGMEIFDPTYTARFGFAFVSRLDDHLYVLDLINQSFSHDTGIVVTRGAWFNLKARLDFASKTTQFYFNGAEAGPLLGWDDLSFPPTNTIADADIRCTTPGNDSAYVDNYLITTPTPPCPADVNGDLVVNTLDLGAVLNNFGASVTTGTSGDLNNDGVVNTLDLGIVLSHFGSSC